MKYRIGVDDDARIQAIKIDIIADGGSYCGTDGVCHLAQFRAGGGPLQHS